MIMHLHFKFFITDVFSYKLYDYASSNTHGYKTDIFSYKWASEIGHQYGFSNQIIPRYRKNIGDDRQTLIGNIDYQLYKN